MNHPNPAFRSARPRPAAAPCALHDPSQPSAPRPPEARPALHLPPMRGKLYPRPGRI